MKSRVIGRISVAVCIGVQVAFGPTAGKSQHSATVSRPGVFFNWSSRDSISISVVTTTEVVETMTSGRRRHHVLVPGSQQLLEPDVPDLPVIRRLIAIPECDSLAIEVHAGETYEIPRAELESVDPRAERDSRFWAADTYFPRRSVEIEYIGTIRGQKFAAIRFYPVRFNPRRKKLEVSPELTARFRPVNPRSEVVVNSGPMQPVLASVLANYEVSPAPSMGVQLGAVAHSMTGGSVYWASSSEDDWEAAAGDVIANGAADYLIIAGDELDSTLVDTLAARRADYNGLNVAVVKMSQISTSPDVSTTPPIIRGLIDSVYQSESAGHMAMEDLATCCSLETHSIRASTLWFRHLTGSRHLNTALRPMHITG